MLEQELKFDVEPAFALPDLRVFVPKGGRLVQGSEHLRSTYFDTADRALLRARMTLRHRTGSTDTGWQLKVPQEPFREEIRVDSDSEIIPDSLQELLLGVCHGQPLVQVASITTERSTTRLLDRKGAQLVEVDDDLVRATASGKAATVSSWREVEVELGEADLKLLHALGKQLRRAGAQPASAPSKLDRALPDEARCRSRGKQKPVAADVLAPYIAEQYRVMLAGDVALHRGDDAVIHKTRVATRKLRSTLRVFAPLLNRKQATALDRELRWARPYSARSAIGRCCVAGWTPCWTTSMTPCSSARSAPASTPNWCTSRPNTGNVCKVICRATGTCS